LPVAHIARARQNCAERRKLFGLDAPSKTALTDPSGEKEAPGVVIYIPDNGRDPDPTKLAMLESELRGRQAPSQRGARWGSRKGND